MILINLKSYFFYFTIFFVGATILIIEIVGTRLFAPFYGSTIYVWSSLITVTLAALSLGYFFGGKLVDKSPNINHIFNLVFIAGILILFIPLYDSWVLLRTDIFGIKFGPLIASFILFTPALFVLGMISPYAVKIKTRSLDLLGSTAGNLYALSTLGALVGGIVAGFYLVPNFAYQSIILGLGILLIINFFIWQILRVKQNG